MAKNSTGQEQRLFVCDCGDIAHQFVVSWYPEDDEWNDLIYFTVHLNQSHSFWQRLCDGIKYIFGYKCRFGAFDEVLLDEGGAKELKGAIDDFLLGRKKNG